eukprot:scaffold273_cov138-Skeletonema_menzelii.AAC.7
MARPKANAAIDALQMDDLEWLELFDGAAFASSSRKVDGAIIAAAGWCCCVGLLIEQSWSNVGPPTMIFEEKNGNTCKALRERQVNQYSARQAATVASRIPARTKKRNYNNKYKAQTPCPYFYVHTDLLGATLGSLTLLILCRIAVLHSPSSRGECTHKQAQATSSFSRLLKEN